MARSSTERILRKCLIKLMRQKALNHITIGDICEEAEIGKRTFYRYYPDKYALLEDTYIKEFFGKLVFDDDAFPYEVLRQVIFQIYEEKDFYSHAITSKEQNGFWEIFTNLMYPYIAKRLSSDPYIDRAKDFFIRKDIQVTLYMLELWISDGYKITPEEIFKYIRINCAIHGKWEYQLVMGKETDAYSLEEIEKNIW